ncbi:MAG: Glycerol-3-phosphate dehydrogenase [NAD(P)+] [Owenweeksia sp. TMED14]|nr:MAG: Glycerol-3-phosphate dehydrogenase [NAD(P)+] [Owenweeksia sp. TMED14]
MRKNSSIAILGSGSWATALVKLISPNSESLSWWVRDEASIIHIQLHQHNPKYLTDAELDIEKVHIDNDILKISKNADILILAIPSAYLAEAIIPIRSIIKEKFIVSAIKGIIPETHQTVGEYLHSEIGMDYSNFGAILGPCHAEEVALEKLSYLTIASKNKGLSRLISKKLSSSAIQTNRTEDIHGSEYASILKNIYAIAAGVSQSLGYGDNFQAVLVSNSMREMKRFIKSVSPLKRDISKTAYSGDLFVTMYSPFSRNRTLGSLIGKGYTVRSAILEMSMVAEGYFATKHIRNIKKTKDVKMPIASAVYKILYENRSPKKVLSELSEKLS